MCAIFTALYLAPQASSFLLSTPELLDYRTFHSALVSLLRVGGQADLADRETPLTAAGRANAHYCFSVAWRWVTPPPPPDTYTYDPSPQLPLVQDMVSSGGLPSHCPHLCVHWYRA